MGPYDEELGRYLDNDDVQYDVNNGRLSEDPTRPGTYYDGEGRHYDDEYNCID